MNEKIENVLICNDCVNYISNGELPAETSAEEDLDIEHGARYLEIKYKFGSVGVDRGYSLSSCDCCGTTLHGNRHEYDNLGFK